MAKTQKLAKKVEATVSFNYFLDPEGGVKEQKEGLKSDLIESFFACLPGETDRSLVKTKVEYGVATKAGKLPVTFTAKYPISVVQQFYDDEQKALTFANVKEDETEALNVEFAGYSDKLKVKVTVS